MYSLNVELFIQLGFESAVKSMMCFSVVSARISDAAEVFKPASLSVCSAFLYRVPLVICFTLFSVTFNVLDLCSL